MKLSRVQPATGHLSVLRSLLWILFASFTAAFCGCGGGSDSSVAEDAPLPPLYSYDHAAVSDSARTLLAGSPHIMYSDAYLDSLIPDCGALWFDSCGVTSQADTLVAWLRKVCDEGIDPEIFGASLLRERIDSLTAHAVEGSTYSIPDTLASRLEADLTVAMLRYCYGQRYGYVRPHRIFNHLLRDGDAINKQNPPYRELFDLPCDIPSDSLGRLALQHVRRGTLPAFLREIQPCGRLHRAFADEYRRALADSDSVRLRLALINLERSRWRYEHPDTGRYLLVNLAPQMLWAVDTRLDTCVEMRVCCGNRGHKSPMLKSEIGYMEFDPYWVVPQTIIRTEVAALHEHDSAYFARNRMEAIRTSTGEKVDPVKLSAADWRSARFTLRQDKGAGNSLGRIVFRFPNKFSVYLHDTNQPWAFQRDNRAVSHGCIRLQRPMDLAAFLLGPEADSLYIDRIRISIDLPPLTPAGRRLKESDPKPLSRHNFTEHVPIWIDYYTLYPDIHGRLLEFPDNYGYDKELEKALAPLCLGLE